MESKSNTREIKFRAWYPAQTIGKAEGQMKYSYEYSCHGSLLAIAEGDNLALGPNSVKIMQFTGLRDKNGVDIYEGDIVKKLYGSSKPTFVVAWHSERMTYIQQDGYNEPLCEVPSNYIEVIGNIYQTPNL